MSNGWEESAAAWISGLGAEGDFARRFVLDAPMLERARQSGARAVLDVGCGEGRFCRLLTAEGLSTVGIDSAGSLVSQARRLHPDGDYRIAQAEGLPFAEKTFDLVVAYLSLIDIADLDAAVGEMNRVLRPGGHLLIANLTSFYSASNPTGWRDGGDGKRSFMIDHYMDERSDWIGWGDLRVMNWHRPLSTYMSLLLGAGLQLRYFDEPLPRGGEPEQRDLFRRVPPFLVMDWQKP
ncbi:MULTISPECIES: class I SAM-dependent methyltransferase [Ensifer]|uniref:class I SAM-dependent methyltransferase n=1 Tax=Ensifer TaxID=106591 RepID=UPI00132F3701|nr:MULTISPECIES: class I SAM-dependent methyltransferase [Ensifer]MBD9539473.1 class I SAM-dependent methyltransferase [Ensifer sp. ENS04]QHG72761.1 class I SAM-dependent methyltransferase [Ensifer adhaerens]